MYTNFISSFVLLKRLEDQNTPAEIPEEYHNDNQIQPVDSKVWTNSMKGREKINKNLEEKHNKKTDHK